jgi:hypothetical protein
MSLRKMLVVSQPPTAKPPRGTASNAKKALQPEASAEFALRKCLDAKPPTGSSIAGDDERLVLAQAVIEGDKVLVSSLLIARPGDVRFA